MAPSSSTGTHGRRSERRTLAASLVVAGLLSVAVASSLSAGGCSSRPLRPAPGIDCSEEAPYDLVMLDDYDNGNYGWYSYGDTTPGAIETTGMAGGATTVEPDGGINYSFTAAIENGGLCGVHRALFLQAHGYQDYGTGWGTYNIGVVGGYMGGQTCTNPGDGGSTICPIDASAYEGVAFWARSYDPTGAPTTNGFTLSINDKNSHGGYVPDASTATGYTDSGVCITYDAGVLGNGSAAYTNVSGMGPAGGATVSAQPPPDACGNNFVYPMITTEHWHLYTIPWSSFHQAAMPNRIPTGFDPSTLFQFLIIGPKEARLALWMAKLGLYRHKQADAGIEAGSEAGP